MQRLQEALQAEAEKIDAEIEKDLLILAKEHESQLLEVLRYGLLGGGKRIRPFLVLLSAALCSDTSDDRYSLSIAFEYLHAATLFHDDIIDQSELRRGKPAVHTKFGTVAAILAGDFLLAHSMEIVGRRTGQRGLKSFNLATKGMVDGEFWQLRNASTYNLNRTDYFEAVMRKTGLLITSSCEIGGMAAGGNEMQLAALRCYGQNLGLAFQIVDDLLDYTGNSLKTGKAVGNDLKEGKMTLPLILAIDEGDKICAGRLQQIIENDSLRNEEGIFEEVYGLIKKCNGFARARFFAEQAIAEGVAALVIFDQRESRLIRELMQNLGEFVLHREK